MSHQSFEITCLGSKSMFRLTQKFPSKLVLFSAVYAAFSCSAAAAQLLGV
jgi:hypothetical protein